jgi:hypothetical protein
MLLTLGLSVFGTLVCVPIAKPRVVRGPRHVGILHELCQTVLEWGRLGGVWALLFFGGIAAGI